MKISLWNSLPVFPTSTFACNSGLAKTALEGVLFQFNSYISVLIIDSHIILIGIVHGKLFSIEVHVLKSSGNPIFQWYKKSETVKKICFVLGQNNSKYIIVYLLTSIFVKYYFSFDFYFFVQHCKKNMKKLFFFFFFFWQ